MTQRLGHEAHAACEIIGVLLQRLATDRYQSFLKVSLVVKPGERG